MLRALERAIEELRRLRAPLGRRRAAVEALVGAGELEAALADAGDPLETTVARATDALAAAAMGEAVDLAGCAEALAHARAPRSLAIRPAAGFAQHALHPRAYACANELVDSREALVVGVRAIGTTLSAVTAAALRARGLIARRITVAPGGEDHLPQLGAHAMAALGRARESGATVLVVDEGPDSRRDGLVTAGEAVVAAGVARERVILLGNQPFDCGRTPRTRYAFRTAVAPTAGFAPVSSSSWGAPLDISAGAWRSLHYTHVDHWPAVVEGMERRKLVADGRLYKFEGLGSSGQAARHRASALAAEGIALDPSDEGEGWTSYAWSGRPMHPRDLDVELVEHIARYCARRPTLCPLVSAETDLEPIVALNVELVLDDRPIGGTRLAALVGPGALKIERIATTDSRLAPHEWLRMEDGSVRKTDAIAHGDDHLFPGPTDIAWDLAGAIIEWEMSRDARDHFLTAYRRTSGDDARGRLDAWLVAYAAIRGGFSLFALAHSSPAEARRLHRELERYRAVLRTYLEPAARVTSAMPNA